VVFDTLKQALCSATCLALPQWDKTFQCVVDASATGVGGVLMRSNRPIAFLGKRLNSAERNYSNSDRELLAAVKCLKEWRVYLSSTPPSSKRNKLITDHQPNVTVLAKKDLSSRQCRSMEIFQEFPLTWMYEKGISNIADPVSRLPESKQAAILSLNVFRNEVMKEFMGPSHDYSHLFSVAFARLFLIMLIIWFLLLVLMTSLLFHTRLKLRNFSLWIFYSQLMLLFLMPFRLIFIT
jgi:hypothetical protein